MPHLFDSENAARFGTAEYVFLHDVVHAFADRLYHGYEVLSAAAFRVTRNSNLYLEEEESRSILESVDMQLPFFAKFNSLLDQKIIEALYRASQAGVRIELLVRGACALRPGVRGLSSRIRVRSVIGRFLEHSRIFVFGNGGRTEVYLGSADWMQRNIYERVEVIFQLKDRALCSQVFLEVVAPYLADTEKTRVLMPTGEYVRRHALRSLGRADNNRNPFNAQEFLIAFAESRQSLDGFPSLPAFMQVGPSATTAAEAD